MLTMSDTQVDDLADYKLELFERRCLAYLEDHFPERTAYGDPADPTEPERALADVHAGVESASLRGCVTEAEVVKYLYLRALLGSDFDLDPASSPVAALMNDERLAIDERLERSFDLAAQAAGDGDELTPDAPAIGARVFP